MKTKKPVIGSLVRLMELDDFTADERELYDSWKNKVGLVTRCLGIRCDVLWNDGRISLSHRSALEVL